MVEFSASWMAVAASGTAIIFVSNHALNFRRNDDATKGHD